MAHIPLLPPRGDAATVATHVGPEGSIVVNLTGKTVHVQDGATPGGFALARVGHQHAQNEILSALGYTPLDAVKVGQSEGVAPLGVDSKIPAIFLPDGITEVTALDISTALGYTPVSKSYVDDQAAGMVSRGAVRTTTTGNLTATYNNGTAGVGATLQGSGSIPQIGGVTPAVNDRILVKNQTVETQNGPYVVTQLNPWILTRADDVDTMTAGAAYYVQEGTLQGSRWSQLTTNPTLGTTNITYTQVGGGSTYTNGTGINIVDNVISNAGLLSATGTGNQISATTTNGVLSIALTPSVNISGTMTAAGFAGSGASLTALNASNLSTGTVPTARLGTGTASGATFLSGDGTWKAVTANVTSLQATSGFSMGTTTGIYAGTSASGTTIPIIGLAHSLSPTGEKHWFMAAEGGQLRFGGWTDDFSAAANYMVLDRNGNSLNSFTVTATSIALTGAVTGTSFSGVGTNLTALNASNLTTGTVATARLGSGTANTTTFLRGDGTWATPTATLPATVTTNSIFNGQIGINTATPGIQIGRNGGSSSNDASMVFTNSGAPTNQKMIRMHTVSGSGEGGAFAIEMLNDAFTATSPFFVVNRSGITPTLITMTATGINLAVGTSGLQVNGAAGTAGQVLTSNGAGAAPTWQNASAGSGSVTSVNLTSANAALTVSGGPITSSGSITVTANQFTTSAPGIVPASGGGTTNFLRADGTWAAVNAGGGNSWPVTSAFSWPGVASAGLFGGNSAGKGNLVLIGTTGGTNEKAVSISTTATGMEMSTVNDVSSGGTTFFSMTRSGITPTLITMTATGINLAVGTSGLQVNGAAGTAGQVLTSNGNAAAPTWQSLAASRLSGTTAIGAGSSTTGVYAGTATSGTTVPMLSFVHSSSPVNEKIWYWLAEGGQLVLGGYADGYTASANFIVIDRNANALNAVTITSPTVTVSGNTNSAAFIPSGATVPTNGMYLPAANSIGFSTNTTNRLSISATGVISTAVGTSVDFGSRHTNLNNSQAAAASTTINCLLSNVHTVTMGAAITTLAFSNVPASGRAFELTLVLVQDATGNRAITWPASVKWPGGTAPTLSGANKTDIVKLFTTNGGTTWFAKVDGLNY